MSFLKALLGKLSGNADKSATKKTPEERAAQGDPAKKESASGCCGGCGGSGHQNKPSSEAKPG